MSSNRLFLYDPETERAVCIAKGYSTGWSTGGKLPYLDDWFDDTVEFTGSIDQTRLQLITENQLRPGIVSSWVGFTPVGVLSNRRGWLIVSTWLVGFSVGVFFGLGLNI